jgi:integrator complex subunit 11
MEVLILGAGQHVGKSCSVVTVSGTTTVMFDCGLHPHNVTDMFPDFTRLSRPVDCVVITHLHVDHIGALPVLVHQCGYNGPIVSSLPSKTLASIMLTEAGRFATGNPCFSNDNIQAICQRIIALPLNQPFRINEHVQLTMFYAGHVLGGTMALIESKDGKSALYTGDFNMTADRQLGAAKPPRCYPDVLITESTYADFVRDSKKKNERLFLQEVQDCLAKGGKVLVSSSAVGRAQELCMLLESCWEKLPPEYSKVPIFINRGMAWQATGLYKLFVGWANSDLKHSYLDRNIYDLPNVHEVDALRALETPGPMILFATPGMIMGGQSLNIFKQLSGDPRNLVVLPG